jgi:hypothetical protein
LTFQRVSTERSIKESVFDESPTIITRFVAERGWSITGALATLRDGRPCACVRRSWTICRARARFVPGSKNSTMDERPVTDSERIERIHGTPFSNSSMGTVMRASTSVAARPSASVWTSTDGSENSGRASTGIVGRRATPNAISAAAAASTKNRN